MLSSFSETIFIEVLAFVILFTIVFMCMSFCYLASLEDDWFQYHMGLATEQLIHPLRLNTGEKLSALSSLNVLLTCKQLEWV